MDAGWFAVLGVAIGGLISIVPVWLQTRAQVRSERLKQAAALATEDFRLLIDVDRHRGGGVMPLAGLVHFHARVLEELSRGRLTPQRYQELRVESGDLFSDNAEALAQQMHRERDERAQASKGKA